MYNEDKLRRHSRRNNKNKNKNRMIAYDGYNIKEIVAYD